MHTHVYISSSFSRATVFLTDQQTRDCVREALDKHFSLVEDIFEEISWAPIDSPCECEPNNPDSLDARLFPSVVLAVAPAVTHGRSIFSVV